MHVLQPKHTKLDEKETEKILKEFNIAKSQLPKIFKNDPILPDNCKTGEIIKIERKDPETEKTNLYYRVVI